MSVSSRSVGAGGRRARALGGAACLPFPVSLSIATYSTGIRQTPRMVAISMPANTAMPITLRPSAPAPVAVSRGVTPRMKAKAVIRIGRKRSLADSSTAVTASLPCSRSIFANSTMRMAFLAARPMSRMSPIWAKTLLT